MPESNLERAFSSKLSLVVRDGKKFVRKQLSAEEAKNEMFFFDALKKAGIPSLDVEEDGDGLLVEYIESMTLGDCETVETSRSFGSLVRQMHGITFDTPFKIDGEGKRHDLAWSSFIESEIQEAIVKQEKRQGFSKEMTMRIAENLRSRSCFMSQGAASLVHCDLHGNNVLIAEDEKMYLIDKGSAIVAGDPMYDLALVWIGQPGVYDLNQAQDPSLLSAFIEGYGSDFTRDRERLEGYVLLRAFGRWPNPFETEIPTLVEKILER